MIKEHHQKTISIYNKTSFFQQDVERRLGASLTETISSGGSPDLIFDRVCNGKSLVCIMILSGLASIIGGAALLEGHKRSNQIAMKTGGAILGVSMIVGILTIIGLCLQAFYYKCKKNNLLSFIEKNKRVSELNALCKSDKNFHKNLKFIDNLLSPRLEKRKDQAEILKEIKNCLSKMLRVNHYEKQDCSGFVEEVLVSWNQIFVELNLKNLAFIISEPANEKTSLRQVVVYS